MPSMMAWLYRIWEVGTGGKPCPGRVQEGADLLVEQAALAGVLEDRDHGVDMRAGHVVVQGHGAAHGAVPAVGGGNAESAFGTEDDGVAGGVDVHGPRDAEVKDDAALETDEGRCEVVHGEPCGIRAVVLRVLAEEIGDVAGNGQRLRIADGVQDHVEGVAADVAQSADAARGLLDERGARDAATTAAAGLDVVDLAEDAGVDDLLDHLHVGVETGLEADGDELAGGLFSLADGLGLFQGHGEGLLQEDRDAVLQRVDGGSGVLSVVGADGDAVQIGLVVDQLLVGGIETDAFHAEALHELLSLAGDQVRGGDDFHVLHELVALDMALRDPAGTDDADLQLLSGLLLLFDDFLLELAQYFVRHVFCPPFLIFLV